MNLSQVDTEGIGAPVGQYVICQWEHWRMRGTHSKTQEEANDRIEKTPPESITKNWTIDILREAVQGLKAHRHGAAITVNVLFAVHHLLPWNKAAEWPRSSARELATQLFATALEKECFSFTLHLANSKQTPLKVSQLLAWTSTRRTSPREGVAGLLKQLLLMGISPGLRSSSHFFFDQLITLWLGFVPSNKKQETNIRFSATIPSHNIFRPRKYPLIRRALFNWPVVAGTHGMHKLNVLHVHSAFQSNIEFPETNH